MITGAMEDLASHIRSRVKRPVTTDPRGVVAPGVLVEPPRLEPDGPLCGGRKNIFDVWVIGTPGARAELTPLAELLDAVLAALEDEGGPGFTYADFNVYIPLTDAASAEPSMAYKITCEVFA